MSVLEFFNVLFITIGIVIIIEFFKFCLIIAFMEKISVVNAGRMLVDIIKEWMKDQKIFHRIIWNKKDEREK